MEFRLATIEDIDELVERRMAMRAEREGGPCPINLEEFRILTKNYFTKHLPDESFIAWLALEQNIIIATSGMCIYSVPPTYGNTSARVAYLVNMYTVPEYRNQGIAANLLKLLVEEAKKRGCGRISLNTSIAGRSIYENYGFTEVVGEMEYFLE